MHLSKLLAAAACATSLAASAAAPVFMTQDYSSNTALDKATALAAWDAKLQGKLALRLAKLYPVRQWGFISQVEGGFTAEKTCVITARAVLAPRRGKALVFTPEKTATAFDARPNATPEQCKELARSKLEEAISAVTAALVADR